MLRLLCYYIRTKLFFQSSRLIRFPIEIRGKRYIDFGKQLTTGVGCRIEGFPLNNKGKIIKFGNNIEINDYVHIAGIKSITIGDNVLIASKVFISDIQHGNYTGSKEHDSPNSRPNDRLLSANPVTIEENVWIGENVTILKGVTIGKGSIIGANSVVTKSIPKGTIATGIPAKAVKKFNENSNKWEKC
ncbi:MAG: hypothetical protein KAI29_25970 [Cyclobacteriaceae bacterium]|nr:hypothetical protein [Cyclobacteriaceae bacterium]